MRRTIDVILIIWLKMSRIIKSRFGVALINKFGKGLKSTDIYLDSGQAVMFASEKPVICVTGFSFLGNWGFSVF